MISVGIFCRPRALLILIDGTHAVQRYINGVIRTADMYSVVDLDVTSFRIMMCDLTLLVSRQRSYVKNS